jgi:transcriptional regulator with XRE-family HTH domain
MTRTADFVRGARKRLGLTQREFAKLLGVAERTVIRWEQPGASLKRRDRLAIEGLAAQASKDATP